MHESFPATNLYDTELYTLIGEPVSTVDGDILLLLEDRDGNLNVRVQNAEAPGSLTMWYSRDYVLKQGEGNFYHGAAIIARPHLLLTDPET